MHGGQDSGPSLAEHEMSPHNNSFEKYSMLDAESFGLATVDASNGAVE